MRVSSACGCYFTKSCRCGENLRNLADLPSGSTSGAESSASAQWPRHVLDHKNGITPAACLGRQPRAVGCVANLEIGLVTTSSAAPSRFAYRREEEQGVGNYDPIHGSMFVCVEHIQMNPVGQA